MTEAAADNLILMSRLCLVAAALVLVCLAAVIDVRKFIIPNWLNASLLGLGLLFAIASSFSNDGFSWVTHVACFVLLFCAGTLLFAAGLLGGGDVKLLSVVAFWAGPSQIVALLVYTVAAGGVVSLVYLVKAVVVQRSTSNGLNATKEIAAQPVLTHTDSDVAGLPEKQQSVLKAPVPYGVAIAVGGVYVFASIARHLGYAVNW